MNWMGIVGHDRQKMGMERILLKGRLGQAYLLTGPSGVGKRKFAKAICAALLCSTNATNLQSGACGTCESCLLCERDSHPDLLTVAKPDERSEFPVKLMQEFCARFYLKPMVSGRKVAILDDADSLSPESANCFLKTLEEPPAGMVVFLVGERLEKQLQTVLSRCQQISFGPLETNIMDRMVEEETKKLSEWNWAKWASGGSISSAKAISDPKLWVIMEKILRLLARQNRIEPTLAEDLVHLAESAGDSGATQRPKVLDFLRAASRVFSSLLAKDDVTEFGAFTSQEWVNQIKPHLPRPKLLRLLEVLTNSGEQVERFIPMALGMAWLAEEIHQIAEA